MNDGIPCFLQESDFEEYGLAPDMEGLNRLALRDGWRAAIESRMTITTRGDYNLEYITSEARADFRFLLPADNNRGVVLDIGSGWGNIAVALARAARQVVAVDTNQENLRFVRTRAQQEGLSNILVARADASQLPLLPESCDIALLVGVLEWVPWGRVGDPRTLQCQALRNIHRTLKPGGCLYVGIENRFSFKYFLGAREPHTGLRFVSLLPKPLASRYSYAVRGRDFRELTHSSRSLSILLREAGFDRVSFWYPIPGYQNFRFLTDHTDVGVSRLLWSTMRVHPKFTTSLYWISLFATLFRVHKSLSSCFSVIAYKDHD